MKTLLIIALFALSLGAYSQKNSDTTSYLYCEIVSVAKYNSPASQPFRVNLFYDFGDLDSPMKDKNGQEIEFESEIDAINFLAKSGWELKTSTTFYMVQPSWRWVTHHYLRKPK